RSRANAPWSRRRERAPECRQLRTYPPDPSAKFAGGNVARMLRPGLRRFEELHHARDVTRARAESIRFLSGILLILLRIRRPETTAGCQQLSEDIREAEVELLVVLALVAAVVHDHGPIGAQRQVGAAREAEAEADRGDVLAARL